MSLSDKARVEMLRTHAESSNLPNLRTLCKVWLLADNGSEGKTLAQQRIREWIDRGDPSKDATL